MAPIPLNISDEERFALMKFRNNIRDVMKKEYDDYYLMRWLKARKWNPENAEQTFRASLKWREEWKVDELESWEAPKVFKLYYPSGISGYDKEGSPVIIVPFSGLDMYGMVNSARRSDFVRYTLLTLERYLKEANKQSKEHGHKAKQLVAIIDMEGFNMRQYVWRPAAELVVALIKMYEANYPEILKSCFIINVNRVFYFAFSLIKGFLNEDTLSKIKIFKKDKKKYMTEILELVEADQIPKSIGGTQVDKNGDESCSSKIHQGGKIPTSYYYRKPEQSAADDSKFSKSEIKKGGTLSMEFKAPAKYVLKYEFRTEGPVIKYEVQRSDKKKKIVVLIPSTELPSSKINELGAVSHDEETTYKLIFDNSGNSMESAKIIHYIQVLPPLTNTIDEGTKD